MKKNILYQALFALGLMISIPCAAASLNKQMKAAKSSAEMAKVIQKAAKRPAYSQWIEQNIYKFIDQIEKDARSGEDENALRDIIENTKQALNKMPRGKGRRLAEKLNITAKSLGLKWEKERAEAPGVAGMIEINADEWEQIQERYIQWLTEEGAAADIPDEISAEISAVNQQTGDTKTVSETLWNYLEAFRASPSSEEEIKIEQEQTAAGETELFSAEEETITD